MPHLCFKGISVGLSPKVIRPKKPKMKLALVLLFVIQFLWIGGNAQWETRDGQLGLNGNNRQPRPPPLPLPPASPPKYSPVQLGGSSGVSTFELFKETIAKVFINEITRKYI